MKINIQNTLDKLVPVHTAKTFQAGQPLMLELFATWCAPCRAAIPHVAELSDSFPHVHVQAVSDENIETIKAFTSRVKQTQRYNVAADPQHALDFLRQYEGVKGVPHCFLFDGAGTLRFAGHPMDSLVENTLTRLNQQHK